MTSIQNSVFLKLGIKVKNKYFLISQIGLNNEKKEFFYHFLDSETVKHQNVNMQINNKKEIRGLLDHISFHNNGKIHLTYKHNKKGKKNRDGLLKIKNNVIESFEEKSICLLIDSRIYLNNFIDLKEINMNEVNNTIIWELTENHSLSIILFKIHKTTDHDWLFKTYGFDQNLNLHSNKYRFDFYDNHSILIVLSYKTLIIPSNINILNQETCKIKYIYEIMPNLLDPNLLE